MGRKILLVLILLSPLSLYPFLRNSDATIDVVPVPPPPLTPDQQIVFGCLSIFPGQSFPASIPWEPYRHIGQQESRALEELAKEKPIEFLESCLSRCEKEVQGYRCIFDKVERVDGKLRQKEKLRVHFREKPFSVHMEWLAGKDKAIRTLYVEGENDGLLMARVFFDFGPIFHKKVDAPDVKATSRFPITQFGMFIGAKDTLYHMQAAQKAGTLHVRYEGIIPVKELGNRLCYKFVRTPYTPPEGDDVNELTIYIDQVTHLQTGSVLKDSDGKLIAEYFFHDIQLNPTFSEKQFTQKAL